MVGMSMLTANAVTPRPASSTQPVSHPIPLALPVWLSGIRLAALSTVSIAVIAAWINAGGLGTLIFEGLSQNNLPKIWGASVLIVLLSLWLQSTLEGFEAWALAKAEGVGS